MAHSDNNLLLALLPAARLNPGIQKHVGGLGPGRRQIVERESHLVTVEIDLEHAIDRLADDGELVERGTEKFLLHCAVDCRDQNDKPRMERLRRIELPEVAGVVGDAVRLWNLGQHFVQEPVPSPIMTGPSNNGFGDREPKVRIHLSVCFSLQQNSHFLGVP